jgi:hypothetical protein
MIAEFRQFSGRTPGEYFAASFLASEIDRPKSSPCAMVDMKHFNVLLLLHHAINVRLAAVARDAGTAAAFPKRRQRLNVFGDMSMCAQRTN